MEITNIDDLLNKYCKDCYREGVCSKGSRICKCIEEIERFSMADLTDLFAQMIDDGK